MPSLPAAPIDTLPVIIMIGTCVKELGSSIEFDLTAGRTLLKLENIVLAMSTDLFYNSKRKVWKAVNSATTQQRLRRKVCAEIAQDQAIANVRHFSNLLIT